VKVSTQSTVTHRSTVEADKKQGDGGRALLLELFDDVHSDKRVGKMTAHFGVGGSISLLTFEEVEIIPQKEIEVEEQNKPAVKRYL
jgi:hypothetical protein